jgi:methylenetetrahydrofolate reductase (NADPH)
MNLLREEGLTERVSILAGVTPLKSAAMARYMAGKVAGMDIPESLIKRLAGVPKEKAQAEGMKICLETISELRQINGVHGVHIMAIESEDRVPEIVAAAGLVPRTEALIPGGSHA